jgi:uncharacterized membrane protein YheB (UPF0754 family)
MDWLNLILTPLVGAVIGYFTNWLAIKMLFRPHEAKYIGKYRLPFTPGLIPKERARLTKKISETVEKHLLTPEVLTRELASMDRWKLPDTTLGELLAQLGVTDLPELIKKTVSEVWQNNESAINDAIPGYIEQLKTGLENNPLIDETLENLVRSIIDKNFNRFIGIFIDHRKIYANIKEGLFAYISDPEHQAVIFSQLNTYAGQPLDGLINGICDRITGFRLSDGQKFLADEKYAPVVRRVIGEVAGYAAKNIQVGDMIEKKINELAVDEAENIVLSVVNRELQMITVLGGVLGFIIGLLSLIPQLF